MGKRAAAALALLALIPSRVLAQFGQNQVIVDSFQWKYRSSEHFDVYYYEGSQARAAEAAEILERAFKDVTKKLDIDVEPPPWMPERSKKYVRWERRPYFLYASPNDFEQSNIAQTGDGTGGVTEPFKDRFMVYNNGERQWLEEVTTHEFTHIMQFYVLNSGFWKSGRILKSIAYPLWWIEGMPEYMTYGIESSDEEVTIRDAATSDYLIPLVSLEHFGHLKPHQVRLAYDEGGEALAFLASQYGRRKVGDMLRLFESRIETSQVLMELIGLDAFQFDRKFREFEEDKYRRLSRRERLREPEAYGGPLTKVPDSIPQYNTCPVFSPDGRTMYYLTTSAGHPPRLRRLDTRTGRSEPLPGIGYVPIENIQLGNFSGISRVLAISPDGSRLAFAGTKNHRDALFLYDIRRERLEKREMPGFQTVGQPAFSPDGRKLAFSGMKGAYSDLYLYDLDSGAVEPLTDDTRDDQMPYFTPDGRSIVYSAEVDDPLEAREHERRLYRLDLADKSLTRLEDSGGQARDPVVSADGKKVLFVNNDGAFFEICELDLASGKVTRLTRTVGGMFTPTYVGGQIAFSSLRRGDVHIYKGERADFLAEPVPPVRHEAPPSSKFLLPGMGSVQGSTATAVALSAEKPYRFSYSTDLFLPAFFYSSVGGFFWTSYWQGSDLLGNHQNTALVDFHSGNSFDYQLSYAYLPHRAQFLFQAAGYARQDLIDVDTAHTFDDKVHAQLAEVLYPLDRYHRLEGALQTASERTLDTSTSFRDDREARMATASFVRDTARGRYLVATAGNRARASYTQAAEAVGGNRRYSLASVEGHQFLPTGGQSAIALRVVGAQALGRDSPQLILGGLGGVRGYARSTIENFGDRLVATNAEWRFPVLPDLNYHMWYFFPDFYFKAVFGSLFTDTGYAWNSEGQLGHSGWPRVRNSVGLGMSIYTFILEEYELVVTMNYARRTTSNGGIFYVYLGQIF